MWDREEITRDMYWVEGSGNPRTKGTPDDLIYVGVTSLSIEVKTKDGQYYRITNPDFLRGLKIERMIGPNDRSS